MRLHYVKSYSKKGKDYGVWKIHLPPGLVEKLGWEHGTELEAAARGGTLTLRRAKEEA